MGELEELPLYVPDDKSRLRATGKGRVATRAIRPRLHATRGAHHTTPRLVVYADHSAAAHHLEQPPTNIGAAPEQQIGHLSNFAFLRQVWVPPDEAVAAFDRWRARTPIVRAPRSRLSFGSDLKLTRPPVAVLGAEPLRALSGRLHVAHWPHDVPVEMYLLPWNAFRTVVDLRPRGRRWPAIGVPSGAYFSAGHAVLDVVVAHLADR
ncbi:MAG: hypothetical protein ABJD24_06875 [Acidimicrobiales bacterium]